MELGKVNDEQLYAIYGKLLHQFNILRSQIAAVENELNVRATKQDDTKKTTHEVQS